MGCALELIGGALKTLQYAVSLIYESNFTRAFDDGPRNFELWSSDVDDTELAPLSPNYHTTPTGKRFNSQQI
ncbi:hypothetical protein TNCV_4571801 [Trichonephila clavipes]|nr:hypothetical protein TNCV_4571801 [Trichonephila clavipes]